MTAPASSPADVVDSPARPALTNAGRMLMLTTAFLGWFCAGFHLSITAVVMHPAAVDLLSQSQQLDGEAYRSLNQRSKARPGAPEAEHPLTDDENRQRAEMEGVVKQWVAWFTCAMLFGGAAGGLVFGSLGDRFGRTKGMGLAILTYSLMPIGAYFSDRPETFLICWFLACTGMGGMWPNGVALVSEAWSSLSRPLSAGLIGAAANIGIFLLATWMAIPGYQPVPTSWRWVMWVAASPILLAFVSFAFVPESPLWLASRNKSADGSKKTAGTAEIFQPPLLWITLIGIALATVPIVGGWGSANWMGPWAEHDGTGNPALKAQVNQARALMGIVGSFLGGGIASVVGRRLSYFLVSLIALGIAQYTFWMVKPTDANFLLWVGALGLFSGIYFGWLPYCLPELFPTRARSAGAGVSFNFGRILTAVTVFATGALTVIFNSNYAQIGRITSLIFAIGMIVIWFAPDTSNKQMAD